MKTKNAPEIFQAAITTFRTNKVWAEKAVSQLDDQQLHVPLHEETNCIAVIMKHVSGNLQSRWTEFLSTDGEKDWRNRDDEFVDTYTNRADIMSHWESGWARLFDSLEQLTNEDLTKTVLIRGEAHSVPLALQRSLGHTCYHVGQIVMVARILCTSDWDVITIPRGNSANYNAKVWGQGNFKSHQDK